MYRDEPLDDEFELRELVGDDLVEPIATDRESIGVAIDALRLLQGWVDDAQASSWLTSSARRLDGRSPMAALEDGDCDDVLDACRAYVAAQG